MEFQSIQFPSIIEVVFKGKDYTYTTKISSVNLPLSNVPDSSGILERFGKKSKVTFLNGVSIINKGEISLGHDTNIMVEEDKLTSIQFKQIKLTRKDRFFELEPLKYSIYCTDPVVMGIHCEEFGFIGETKGIVPNGVGIMIQRDTGITFVVRLQTKGYIPEVIEAYPANTKLFYRFAFDHSSASTSQELVSKRESVCKYMDEVRKVLNESDKAEKLSPSDLQRLTKCFNMENSSNGKRPASPGALPPRKIPKENSDPNNVDFVICFLTKGKHQGCKGVDNVLNIVAKEFGLNWLQTGDNKELMKKYIIAHANLWKDGFQTVVSISGNLVSFIYAENFSETENRNTVKFNITTEDGNLRHYVNHESIYQSTKAQHIKILSGELSGSVMVLPEKTSNLK